MQRRQKREVCTTCFLSFESVSVLCCAVRCCLTLLVMVATLSFPVLPCPPLSFPVLPWSLLLTISGGHFAIPAFDVALVLKSGDLLIFDPTLEHCCCETWGGLRLGAAIYLSAKFKTWCARRLAAHPELQLMQHNRAERKRVRKAGERRGQEAVRQAVGRAVGRAVSRATKKRKTVQQ